MVAGRVVKIAGPCVSPALRAALAVLVIAIMIAPRAYAAQKGNNGQRSDPDFDTKVAHPAYTDQHPVVLFDEAHNNFHTSEGRYKVFSQLIKHDGYKVVPNRAPFTSDTLKDATILVIANAFNVNDVRQPAFSEDECQSVQDFVNSGGALLLITDHQPFGAAAAPLAKRFGVDMSQGVTTDEANEDERGLLFSRDKGLLADHPITLGRNASEKVNRVLTFTGQSLKGPEGSVPFLKFADTAQDQNTEGKQSSAAGRAQGIALTHGKGRVVVLGEAAQLSAQIFGSAPVQKMGMNVPGSDNRQMALNIMHWLSRLLN